MNVLAYLCVGRVARSRTRDVGPKNWWDVGGWPQKQVGGKSLTHGMEKADKYT